ncbi:unnamed protein product [Cercospora beticola]|nr:unnamed protein product [Cercospora beticola]
MKFCSLILAAAAAVSAAIVPPPGLQPRQMSFCGTVASRCTGTSRQAQLTTYCSSYLRIPRVTTTRTVTAATVRPTTTVTVRVAGITTITTTISVTRTLSQTSTTNVAIAAATVSTTQTTTSFSTRTTTTTRTVTTRTTSVQAPDVTQMVSECAAPPNPDAAITIMRVGNGISRKEKREASGDDDIVLAKELMERQAIAKPACLASYTSAYRQSSACSCASIRASTSTSTRFVTATSTSTATTTLTTSVNTIRATVTNTVATVTQIIAETVNVQSTFTSTMMSTMTRLVSGPTTTVLSGVVFTRTLSPKSTIYTLGGAAAQPTFYIQNDVLNYAFLQAPWSDKKKKNKRDAAGTLNFDSIPASSAQLFSLPAGMSGPLASSDGSLLAAQSIDIISPDGEGYDNIDVQMVSATDLASGAFGPVSCSVTAGANGTCPMSCWFTGQGMGDINQGNPFGTWMLGQPGSSGDDETWGVWAVTP